MTPTLRLRAPALVITAALLAGACGDDGHVACGEVERILETASIHVLPGVEVTYDHMPPTSGPHAFGGPSPGVYDEPIEPALQVAALETGAVLVQYATELDGAVIDDLRSLADADGVIVSPGAAPFDEGAVVAFTAWGNRQLCDAFDDGAAERFIDRHVGVAFASH